MTENCKKKGCKTPFTKLFFGRHILDIETDQKTSILTEGFTAKLTPDIFLKDS